MGIGGISIWQLLIILAIVIMLFGTKRLRGLGSDLGSAVKGFKKAIDDDPDAEKTDKDRIEKSDGDNVEKVIKDDPNHSKRENSEQK